MQSLNIDKYKPIWITQLLVEYEGICWQFRVNLRTPVFEISDCKREVGSWHAETRTIRLSRHLIAENPWQVTLEVLKHEMAHQLCSELFFVRERGHGREFQRACQLLGVEPVFRRAQSSLPELEKELAQVSEISEKGRRFISKVEKLLALANSANENEAALAMQKANELIEKYNLSFYEAGGNRQFDYVVINKKKKRIESYQRHICCILKDFFFVDVVMSSLYDPKTDQNYKTIELLGTKENVVIAEYCYFFLEQKLASLWEYNRHKFKGRTITEKNSYRLGLLAGFYGKLQQQRDRVQKTSVKAQSRAMILVTADKELAAYVVSRFPRLSKASSSRAKIYQGTYDDGVATGKTITLAKGVGGEAVSSGKLLTTG